MVDQFIGKRIGDYVITHLIARGGMARIYHAVNPLVNHEVAIKMTSLDAIMSDNIHDPAFIQNFCERFHKEARIVAGLENLHILPIYGYDILADALTLNPYIDGSVGLAYIAMRYMRGGSLGERVKAYGALPFFQVQNLFNQIANGLQYAHSRGIIHCDIKPSNILLDENENAFLADFGLARLLQGASSRITNEQMHGTPAYLAPEQIRCEFVDERTDVYSLGLVLYEMLTGKAAFQLKGTNLAGLLTQQLKEMPAPPSSLNPSIPAELEMVVNRAIAKDPNERYPTVKAMASEFNDALFIDPPNIVVEQGAIQQMLRGYASLALVIVFMLGLLLSRQISVREALYTLPLDISNAPTATEIQQAQETVADGGFIAYISCTEDTSLPRQLNELSEQYHIPLRVFNGGRDAYTQITQVESARMQGADALIVCPINLELMTETINTARAAGIPIIVFSNKMIRGAVTISGNHFQAGVRTGRLAGQFINENYNGAARIIILEAASMDIINDQMRGARVGLNSLAPLSEIVAQLEVISEKEARDAIRALIDETVPFNIILAYNYTSATGAIQALEAANISADEVQIFIVDADASFDTLRDDEDYIQAAIMSNSDVLYRSAIDASVKLLGGGNTAQFITVNLGETFNSPYVLQGIKFNH